MPKGVPITFANIQAFMDAFSLTPGGRVQLDDRCLQMFELTFDVSVSSFLSALVAGATVYTVPNDAIKYVDVLRLIHHHGLTHIQIVPSIVRLALPLLKRVNLESVQTCILTGEATTVELLTDISGSFKNAVIFDFYGPTEATVYSTYYRIDMDSPKSYNGMVAIGKPLPGMTAVIMDEKNQIAEQPRVKGELCLAGPQLTKGYLNDPAKNQSVFYVQEKAEANIVYYRTGDICYFDEDGDLYYCGRLDNQIKVNGFRVELSEIEHKFRAIFSHDCVATTLVSGNGSVELVLVTKKSPGFNTDIALDELKKVLPTYMLPKYIHEIEVFPLTSSGKTDRKAISNQLSLTYAK
jgi:D-alanine--poly(phosphoribitol) ligase subunit 1